MNPNTFHFPPQEEVHGRHVVGSFTCPEGIFAKSSFQGYNQCLVDFLNEMASFFTHFFRPMEHTPESLVIRPPSEWQSLLVRITRGCKWNRCRFCGIYPALGQSDFSIRSTDEVKADIDRFRELGVERETAFFGDADPLQAGLDAFVEIARHLRTVYPEIRRLTSYARASTLWKLREPGIRQLKEAGLDRVHIGLESGDEEVLNYHRKGQNRKIILTAGKWLKQAGIEISFYVLLGLGGTARWKAHIDNTASVIEEVDPEFVRIRRIWLYTGTDTSDPPAPYSPQDAECPLWEPIRTGEFVPQTPEGTVLELRRLLEKLPQTACFFTCDHANNYVRVKGRLPADRKRMLEKIDRFLRQDPKERQLHYELVGSRI